VEQARLPLSENMIKTRIIAITNQKGGSGKIITVVNLGACLTRLKKNSSNRY